MVWPDAVEANSNLLHDADLGLDFAVQHGKHLVEVGQAAHTVPIEVPAKRPPEAWQDEAGVSVASATPAMLVVGLPAADVAVSNRRRGLWGLVCAMDRSENMAPAHYVNGPRAREIDV